MIGPGRSGPGKFQISIINEALESLRYTGVYIINILYTKIKKVKGTMYEFKCAYYNSSEI